MNAIGRLQPPQIAGDPDPMVARVVDELRASGYRDLLRLGCKREKGVITLMGNVGSYFLKQMAQTAAGRVPGVTCVNNQLRVSRYFQRSETDIDNRETPSW